MRHFLRLGPAPAVGRLAGRMVESAAPSLLIPPAGGLARRLPGPLRAAPRAVPVAAITPAAEEKYGPASHAGANDVPE